MANINEEILEKVLEAVDYISTPVDDPESSSIELEIADLERVLRASFHYAPEDLVEKGLYGLEDLDEKDRPKNLQLGACFEGLAFVVAAYSDDPAFREALDEYETDILFKGDVVLDPPEFLENLEKLARAGHVQNPPKTKKKGGKYAPPVVQENVLLGWKGAQFWRSLLSLVPQRALEDAGYLRMEP